MGVHFLDPGASETLHHMLQDTGKLKELVLDHTMGLGDPIDLVSDLRNDTLERLSAAYAGWTASIAFGLHSWFKTNNRLKHLDLTGNQLETLGVEELFALIANSVYIGVETLTVATTQAEFDAVTVQFMCEALSGKTCLRTLDIRGNRFVDQDAARALVAYVSKNKTGADGLVMQITERAPAAVVTSLRKHNTAVLKARRTSKKKGGKKGKAKKKK